MKSRIYLVLVLLVLVLPSVYAQDCSITNLGACLPEAFLNLFLSILNAPIQPLLDFIKSLMVEPIDLQIFAELWAIIIYVISLFYGLLFIYSGLNFIISGYDTVKRIKAKALFGNIILMIIFIQASFFLYQLAIDLSGSLTIAVYDMINPDFFLFDSDTGLLSLVYLFPYVTTLLLTVICLIIRYLIVAFGLVLFPIGIFCYFTEPIKEYGKMILNFLISNIFASFFVCLIFLSCSLLIEIAIFANFKILVMISAFLLADLVLLIIVVFAIIKAALGIGSKLGPIVYFIK